eukprot:UN21259
MSNAIQIDAFTVDKKKVVTTRLENIYSTDAFDTLKNGKLRSSAPIIPQSPARLQEETF